MLDLNEFKAQLTINDTVNEELTAVCLIMYIHVMYIMRERKR